jgi:hypothetical protein
MVNLMTEIESQPLALAVVSEYSPLLLYLVPQGAVYVLQVVTSTVLGIDV